MQHKNKKNKKSLTEVLQLKMVSYCICQTSAPLLTMHVLSQFFLHAVIRQECVVCGDCSLAFLKGLETTRDAGQATLHPILQVFIYHLQWSEC